MKRFALLTLAAAAAAISAGAAQAAELYNNGPVVNSSGKSILVSPSTTFGLGAQTSAGNSVADDFTIAAGNSWNVSSLDFFSYQTGATSFTFQQATWAIRSGDANTGTIMASGVTNLTNGGLQGYRVTSTTLTNTQRGIYKAQADVADFSLGAGHYWLSWSLTGTAASGPWQPPVSDGRTGNAMQAATNGSFATWHDAGSTLTGEVPFVINGVAAAVPEPSSYALMLAGAAVMLGVVRRRRQAA